MLSLQYWKHGASQGQPFDNIEHTHRNHCCTWTERGCAWTVQKSPCVPMNKHLKCLVSTQLKKISIINHYTLCRLRNTVMHLEIMLQILKGSCMKYLPDVLPTLKVSPRGGPVCKHFSLDSRGLVQEWGHRRKISLIEQDVIKQNKMETSLIV